MNQQGKIRHTKGPWVVYKDESKRFDSHTGLPIESAKNTWVKPLNAGSIHDYICIISRTVPDDEQPGNALLIAHAPDLLNKLKECSNFLTDINNLHGKKLVVEIDQLIKEIES